MYLSFSERGIRKYGYSHFTCDCLQLGVGRLSVIASRILFLRECSHSLEIYRSVQHTEAKAEKPGPKTTSSFRVDKIGRLHCTENKPAVLTVWFCTGLRRRLIRLQ
jgi:hypothetical protein